MALWPCPSGSHDANCPSWLDGEGCWLLPSRPAQVEESVGGYPGSQGCQDREPQRQEPALPLESTQALPLAPGWPKTRLATTQRYHCITAKEHCGLSSPKEQPLLLALVVMLFISGSFPTILRFLLSMKIGVSDLEQVVGNREPRRTWLPALSFIQ